jgi:hypothetical protein
MIADTLHCAMILRFGLTNAGPSIVIAFEYIKDGDCDPFMGAVEALMIAAHLIATFKTY